MSQGLPGGYDSDVEGQPTAGNLQGFGEKAVRFFYEKTDLKFLLLKSIYFVLGVIFPAC